MQISDGCLRNDFKETVDDFLKDIKDPKIFKNLIKFKEMLHEKERSTAGSTATSSQAASSITEDQRSDEEDVSMSNQSEDTNANENHSEKDEGVFKVSSG